MHVEYERPHLYPKQFAAIFDPHRYSLIEASTKAGKTSGCIAWIVEQALRGKAGDNYWWVAPVSEQAKIAFGRAQRAIPREYFIAGQSPPRITLANGAVIWFKSADKPDSLYGDDVRAAVVDEASRMKEESWHAVRSTLTATRGHVRIIGNVKGRKNWFYRMCRQAEAGDPDMGFHRIQANDAVSAGVLDKAEIEDARRRYPDHVFKELYLAEASDDEGNPFSIEAIRRCIGPMSMARPIVYGWDFAKHVDWTVGIGLDKDGKVCRFHRFQTPWEETYARVIRESKGIPTLVDSTGVGDNILERLQRAPMGQKYEGYTFSPSSKQKLMEGLAFAIQSNEVTYPAGPIVVELEQFEYEIRQTGIRYSAPSGAHDDCVCALALAVRHYVQKRSLARYSSLEWVG